MNTALYRAYRRVNSRVPSRVFGPCTRLVYGHIRAVNTAVFTARVLGSVPCTRPCLWPVYTAVHGRVPTVYTAVHYSNTAVCTARTWPYTGHEHGHVYYSPSTRPSTVYTAVLTARIQGRPQMCTDCVHGRAWAVHDPNTAVSRTVYGRVRSCTRTVNGSYTRQ